MNINEFYDSVQSYYGGPHNLIPLIVERFAKPGARIIVIAPGRKYRKDIAFQIYALCKNQGRMLGIDYTKVSYDTFREYLTDYSQHSIYRSIIRFNTTGSIGSHKGYKNATSVVLYNVPCTDMWMEFEKELINDRIDYLIKWKE